MGIGQANELAALAAVIVGSLAVGYWAGTKTPRSELSSQQRPTDGSSNKNSSKERGDGYGSGDRRILTQSTPADGNVASLDVNASDECKLVLIVRSDLRMSTGKIAAQCSHATLACYKTMLSSNPIMLRQWERSGQTKIALRCTDEDELLSLQAQAMSLNLCTRTIQDAGRTQIAAGSRTVLGVAGSARLINQVTSKLRLL